MRGFVKGISTDVERNWVPLSDNRMPTLMGKYKVPHLDAKGEANRVFTDLGRLTGVQMASALTKALGQEVRYNEVTPEVCRSFGFPGADDLGNMFQFKRDFEQDFCGARNLDLARSLNPSLQTFEAWLAQNKSRIPLL